MKIGSVVTGIKYSFAGADQYGKLVLELDGVEKIEIPQAKFIPTELPVEAKPHREDLT